MHLLFFLLIPVGIVILIFSLRLMGRYYNGNTILELPYTLKTAVFDINQAGEYSIWHKGRAFRKAPLDKFRPVITDFATGENISLRSLLFRPNKNDAVKARMEIFKFSAPAGRYKIELAEGSSITGIENAFIKMMPFPEVDPNEYFIQVRKSQPFAIMITYVLILVIAALAILGGLVLGILGNEIFAG